MDLDNLDLMSLVAEKHMAMRQKCEKLWNDRGKVKISSSEWYLLSRINGEELSISDVARMVDITRQATHKSLLSLKEKGILEIVGMPHNKRDKYVVLTPFGRQCCEENASLKHDLEQKIAATIGLENVLQLKSLLKVDWL